MPEIVVMSHHHRRKVVVDVSEATVAIKIPKMETLKTKNMRGHAERGSCG